MGFDGVKLPHFKGNKKGTVYLTTHRVSTCISFEIRLKSHFKSGMVYMYYHYHLSKKDFILFLLSNPNKHYL